MTSERKFKKEYCEQLIRVAKADLHSAEILYRGKDDRIENIFFHIQQSIEKALNGHLCKIGNPVPLEWVEKLPR